MMFPNLPAAIVCLVLPIFQTAVHAHSGNHEAVRNCGVILRDLPKDLASSFCSSYAEITDITSTSTETKTRGITITTSVACSATKTASVLSSPVHSWGSESSTSGPQPGSSWTVPTSTQHSGNLAKTAAKALCNAVCTVTATNAVISYVTETALMYGTSLDDTFEWLTQRSTSTVQVPKRLKRIPAAFCPEVGVPCLMAGMDAAVVTEGCLSFVKPKVAHTKTKTVKRTSTIITGATCKGDDH